MAKWERIISEEDVGLGCRIDRYLARTESDMSRSKWKKLLKFGRVTVNGKPCRPADMVKSGDDLRVDEGGFILDQRLMPAPLPLSILHEDEDVLVLDKPAGVVVHPGSGTKETTLIEGVANYLGDSFLLAFTAEMGTDRGQGSLRPGIVHRLDKDTSGVMVIAKNRMSSESLSTQFKDRSNLREYWALLRGVPKERKWETESLIRRHPGNRLKFQAVKITDDENQSRGYRYARSFFEVINVFPDSFTLVKVRLGTGRTHQIRVHGEYLGLPVVGDEVYGRAADGRRFLGVARQLLHGKALGFIHPRSNKKLVFSSRLPKDFKEALVRLGCRFDA